MSWLSIPLSNPFKSLNFSDDDQQEFDHSTTPQNDAVSPAGIAVKDEISAIGGAIGRQLRGVAAFLAPPPPENSASSSSAGAGDGVGVGDGDEDSPSFRTLAGIRSDLAEIGGSFKSSLSLLSTHRAVTEISKLASNLLQLKEGNVDDDGDENSRDRGDDDDDDSGIGISYEVIEFASEISSRPELWTDFPLSLNNHEFNMSDAQYEHVAFIEQLVPSLADLRNRLGYDMSEKHFWLIYFILLLPRLNEDDFEMLSTPEIVEARETLLLMLRTKNNSEINSENPRSDSSSELENEVDDTEMEKNRSVEKVMILKNSNASNSVESNEPDNTQKLVEEEGKKSTRLHDHNRAYSKADDPNVMTMVNKEHEKIENLSEEKQEAISTGTFASSKRFQSEDDTSFSDLEVDDDDDDDDNNLSNRQCRFGKAPLKSASSPEGSNEWVRLNRNEGNGGGQLRGQSSSRDRDSEEDESSDWLTVDDFEP